MNEEPIEPARQSQRAVNAYARAFGQGRYDVYVDSRAALKRKAIEDAFHADLFQMSSRADKQMPPREVGERSSEGMIQFSPTFAHMTTELSGPLLARVFGILLRNGSFPQPPQSVIVMDPNGAYLSEPKVSAAEMI